MGKPLGRWRSTDQYGASDFIGATPRAGAALRQITDPPPKKKALQHIHVHLPAGYGSAAAPRQRTRDQASEPGQREEAEGAGRLLCRIGQNGSTGQWSGEDAEGRPLIVKAGANGLDIFSPAEAEGEQADSRPFGATEPPGAASLDALRRRFGPRAAHDATPTSTQQQGRMAAMQEYLNQLWAPR
jgi:hypothetical protein